MINGFFIVFIWFYFTNITKNQTNILNNHINLVNMQVKTIINDELIIINKNNYYEIVNVRIRRILDIHLDDHIKSFSVLKNKKKIISIFNNHNDPRIQNYSFSLINFLVNNHEIRKIVSDFLSLKTEKHIGDS